MPTILPHRHLPRRRLRLAARTVLLLLCVTLGCGNPGSQGPWPALSPVPENDLTGLESGVSEQLSERRAVVDRLRSAPATPNAELALAYSELGLLYVLYDLLEAAGICFENAVLLAPSDARSQYLLAYARGRQGRLDEAAAGYRRALELDPGLLPAWLRLGRNQRLADAPEAARAAFTSALELDPEAAAAHEGLGRLAAEAGDSEAAIRYFERALELDPAASGVRYALAQVYRDIGRLDDARAHLENAGDVATRIPDPLIGSLATRARSAQFYLVQGAEAMDDRAYEAAAAAFEDAAEQDPSSFAAYRGLAVSLERLGDADGARRALEAALEHGTTGQPEGDVRERAVVLRSLGMLAATRGQEERALGHYLASLELRPEQPELILRAAGALARTRRFEDAVAWYDRLIELTPEWAPAVLEKRATALVNLGRGREAVADFERAITAAPNDARLRSRFADALELLGDRAAAEQQRQLAAGLPADEASRAVARLAQARRLAAGGDFEAAAATLALILEKTPGDSEARFELAGILGHLGRFDDAAQEFHRLVAEAPRNSATRRGEIVALILSERYADARARLQEALRHFPRHAGFALTQVKLLATVPDPAVRDGELALEIARRVYAERQDAATREALAVALAEVGRTAEAARLERALLDEAQSEGDAARRALHRARLQAFEADRPWTLRSPPELLTALDA